MTPACMGGWCPVRDRCALHNTDDRALVAERLCAPGEEPQQIHRPAGTWERMSVPHLLRAAEVFDGLAA